MSIWNAKLDDKYDCKVERTSRYTGDLIINLVDTGEEIFRESVTLDYGAAFGPDAADVALWEDRIVRFIDLEYEV